MSKVSQLELALFLEGVQVPIVTASVTSTSGAPSYANIEVLPDHTLSYILPRTMVHVFIKDPNSLEKEKPWILLFEGETYGFSYRKTEARQSGLIQAMGLSSYWDNAKQYYVNLMNSSYNQNNTSSMGSEFYVEGQANINRMGFQQGLHDAKAWVVDKILAATKKEGNDIIDGIISIIRGLEDVNSFFRFGNARQRVSDRIAFMSSGLIEKFINLNKEEQVWTSILSRGNGGVFSLRQMINLVMGMVFHDFSSVVAPSKVKSDISRPIGRDRTINSFIFKPTCFMLTPPRCNVLFPHLYNHLAYDRNYFHEVSRISMQPMPAFWETKQPKIFQKTYYAPDDFQKYTTPGSKGTGRTKSESKGPEGQGNKLDEIKGSDTAATKKRDFHYFSYEEVLKGIFHDMGHSTPNSSTFSRYMSEAEQGTFYQEAVDYLFYEKRYASRGLSTSGPLNLSPIAGLPFMVLDDSDSNQSCLGLLHSITHTVGANSGASTSYNVTFPRPLLEGDIWTGEIIEPPIPSWYDDKIFGKSRKVVSSDWNNLPKKYHKMMDDRFKEAVDFSNIAPYYSTLIGNPEDESVQGHRPLTDNRYSMTLPATLNLLEGYKAVSEEEKYKLAYTYNSRDYVQFHELYEFLGANNLSSKVSRRAELPSEVNGEIFNGGYVDLEGLKLNDIDKNLKNTFGKDAFSRRRKAVYTYRKAVTERRASA